MMEALVKSQIFQLKRRGRKVLLGEEVDLKEQLYLKKIKQGVPG